MESNTHTIELENQDGEKMLVVVDVAGDGGLTLHLPGGGMFWLDDSGRELVRAIEKLRSD